MTEPVTTAARTPAASAAPVLRSPWLVLTGIMLSGFLTAFDGSSVNIVVPAMTAAMNLAVHQAQWVMTGFFLAVVGLLLPCGALADRVGRRGLYLTGTLVFAGGALLSGLAPAFPLLVAARLVQGLGTALMAATNIAFLVQYFPAGQRGKAVGAYSTVVMIGNFSGPAVAGFLIAWLSWRWVFWLNVPVGLLAFALGWFTLPRRNRTGGAPAAEPAGGAFDWPGALLGVAAVTSLVWGLSRLGERLALAWFAAAGVLLGLFLLVESRAPAPMLKLALLRRRGFALGVLGQLLHYATIAGATFAVPFTLMRVLGYGSAQTGLVMMVLSICASVGAPLGGALADRFNRPLVAAGSMALVTAGYLWLFRLGMSLVEAGSALGLVGAGGGAFMVVNRVVVNENLPAADLSVGNALHNTARRTGRLLGVAVAAALGGAGDGVFQALPPLLFCALVAAVGVPVALRARR